MKSPLEQSVRGVAGSRAGRFGAAALLVAGVAAALRYAVKARSSEVFGPSVYRGAGRRRTVALTFDDGPSDQTPLLLQFLAEQGIRATFFQCGMNAERLPAIARAVSGAGHEIGNHTFSHPRLPPRLSRRPNFLSTRFIGAELERTQELLEQVHGRRPRLFRAPYGLRWFGLRRAQRRLGLLGVLWTVIGHDWEWPASRIERYVLPRVAPGGILCFHDGRDIRPAVDLSEMLQALGRIVPALRRQGYRFETVSELLAPGSRP